MRKLLFLIPLLVIMLGITSKGASSADVEKMQQMYNAKFNATLNAYVAGQIIDKWQTTNETYCIMGQYDVYLTNSVNDSGGNFAFTWQYHSTNYSPNFSGTLTWSSAGGSNTLNQQFFLNYGAWNDFHTVPIEWDNPYYSANIPSPVYYVYNQELLPIGPDAPIDLTLDYVPSNVYVEMWADYKMPSNVVALHGKLGASYDYRVSGQKQTVSVNLIDKEDLIVPGNLGQGYFHSRILSGWISALDGFPISQVNITSIPDGWQEGIDAYEELRKTLTLYGSGVSIKLRYFTIVNDTQFVVGSWKIWDSYTPDTFSNELPSSYQPYFEASGNQGTSIDTSSDASLIVGGSDPTGYYTDPYANITYIQNVPNYPDYPTIASYNLDNMLVDTMNNVKGLNTFFGEFGSFLTVSFSFFPAWIWAIIGVGFGISIVVMFLKIL